MTQSVEITDVLGGVVEIIDPDASVVEIVSEDGDVFSVDVSDLVTQVVEVATSADSVVELTGDAVEVDISALGEKGDQGAPGATGPKGDKGDKGDRGLTSVGGVIAYTHVQNAPASVWTIQHNLGFVPNVQVEDSAGTNVEGEIDQVDADNVVLTFTAAFGGVAFLS